MSEDSADGRRVSREVVERFVRDVLISAGVNEEVAGDTAEGLVMGSMRGVDSHGIRLLPHYIKELEAGRINAEPEFSFDKKAPAVGQFDADHTYGIAAGIRAMDRAIELARDTGVGHVSVSNSTHNGMMAYFGLEAAREGMIGIATTQTSANTRPPNGVRPFFGSNPICVAAQMADEEPFCYDAATSAITFNEVRKRQDAGEKLPRDVAADKNGIPTRNPEEAVQLLPLGGYKGFGLSVVVDIFNGLLSGMSVGREVSEMYGEDISNRRNLGHYYAAFRIDAFVEVEEFKQRLQQLAEDVRNEPRRNEDTPNYVPGDPEKEAKNKREQKGIPVTEHELKQFDTLANKYGVDPVNK
jgi:LDH2 family malate/lactate/ureidoglycolate dehydrogenase